MKPLILISLVLFGLFAWASEPNYEVEYLTTKKGLRLVRIVKLVKYSLYCSVENGNHKSNFTVNKKVSRWYRIYSSDVEVKCHDTRG